MTYSSIVAAATLNWNGDADENGTGDANDNTANSNNGTWAGTPAYGTAPYGAGKTFDLAGSSSISLTGMGVVATSRSISVWFKSSSGSNDLNIVAVGDSSSDRIQARLHAGALRCFVDTTNTTVSSGLNDGNWHHLAIVMESGVGTRFYIDTTLVATMADAGSFGNAACYAGSGFLGSNFVGELYDVIYDADAAWSTGDITALYNEGSAPADVTAPTLLSAVIASTGDTITLTFDEAVTGSTGVTLVAPTGVTATYSSGDTTTALVYTLSRTVGYSESLLLNYTAGNITDIATNALATISDFLVTNQSLVGAGGSGSVLSSGIKSGGQL